MRRGDLIIPNGEAYGNGYLILEDGKMEGQSIWSFAKRRGRDYFIKQYLAPKYPTEDSPGSPESKRRKKERCDKFEQQYKAIQGALKGLVGKGGNLVGTLDFFRSHATYYKITEKIDTTSLSISDISRLPLNSKLFIIRTCLHSVKTLHQQNIIHADLKPNNILVKELGAGRYISKVIDFDNSFFVGKEPLIDVTADQVYFSPELMRYLFDDPETRSINSVNSKSDVFALGIIIHQYLTGSLPEFDKTRFQYVWEAVSAGQEIKINVSNVPDDIAKMLMEMLCEEPSKRPSVSEVFARVAKPKNDTEVTNVNEPLIGDDGEQISRVKWNSSKGKK